MCTLCVNVCVCVCVCVDLGFFPVDPAMQNLCVCFHSVDWNLKDMGSKNVISLDFFGVLTPPHVCTTTSADKPVKTW